MYNFGIVRLDYFKMERLLANASSSSDSKLKMLRDRFSETDIKLSGYYISSFDQHSSEYVAEWDKRIQYMTGFTGSAGFAIVTMHDAALWVDGRYYIQASSELEDPFKLIKHGSADAPKVWEWLSKRLPKGGIIGTCGKYMPASAWFTLSDNLEPYHITLLDVPFDMVDSIWVNRPSRPQSVVTPHLLKFSGRKAAEKIKVVRDEMIRKNVELLVISELDEVAWILNLRGTNILYNPVFYGFIIVSTDNIDVFVDDLNEKSIKHISQENVQIEMHSYDAFYDILYQMVTDTKVSRVWISDKANYRIYCEIPITKTIVKLSPVSIAKCVKNNAEVSGMIEAHVYDGYAMCKFFCLVEKQLKKKRLLTEISAANMLEEIKKKNSDYIGPSFKTISASGPHSAIIHYRPKAETNRPLSLNEIYLCDSGSHYVCGTTDITRTYHFGKPTEYEKQCYTKVFKGQVCLSTAIFPENTKGSSLDVFARRYLWEDGLDYNHGTGHGIGSYLNVHEGPIGINHKRGNDLGLLENMFLSNEPGYYKENHFGIRLENIEHVIPYVEKEANRFLAFETVTLCPYQTSMLCTTMLTPSEISYLNEYHLKIRTIFGPVFKSENDMETLAWIKEMTEPLVV